ncbi:MAG: glycosyltransferase family 2 protein [Candidatus Nanopelagicales bacterium]|jgi:glycosyltransferase involved in cell wall biosynthesis|nr:glycosyltransferase family 2 protein [Candidatus Nanopelagicales bacterium]MDP4824314.1 glycosyltransferase family 2 protein [Candidatus Nanopelagicales bacterium]MDP4888986.1 glycosyltransferase family 2 protein [Candidatus Nanopelagicales bacterium]
MGTVTETVSVLIPARDEEHRITPTLEDALAQQNIPNVEFIVLNDGSTDGTGGILRSAAVRDSRLKVINGDNATPPSGWLGKTWACHRLSEAASGRTLVFIDADVCLAPDAIAACVELMRSCDLQLFSPYPRMLAKTWLERLVQPLVVWSWMSMLPVRSVENKPYPSLAAANGQFIVVDALAYRTAGGHRSVSGEVIEDVALLRSFKRHGFRGAPGNGAHVATCRMYTNANEVWSGYTKSLWSVFGGRLSAAVVGLTLLNTYFAPIIFMTAGPTRTIRLLGTISYASGVYGRAVIARHTRERAWPDALAHPMSIVLLTTMMAASVRGHRRGTLRWRGRPVAHS